MTSPDSNADIMKIISESTILKEQAERFAKLAESASKRAERYRQYSEAFLRAVEVLCKQASKGK